MSKATVTLLVGLFQPTVGLEIYTASEIFNIPLEEFVSVAGWKAYGFRVLAQDRMRVMLWDYDLLVERLTTRGEHELLEMFYAAETVAGLLETEHFTFLKRDKFT